MCVGNDDMQSTVDVQAGRARVILRLPAAAMKANDLENRILLLVNMKCYEAICWLLVELSDVYKRCGTASRCYVENL